MMKRLGRKHMMNAADVEDLRRFLVDVARDQENERSFSPVILHGRVISTAFALELALRSMTLTELNETEDKLLANGGCPTDC